MTGPCTDGRAVRAHAMDELRGILILYVVLYHLLYDLAVVFPVEISWMFDPWMNVLRDCMTGTLIMISGVSCLYSRNNLRRGLKTFGWGMALTLGTLIAMPSQLILFGILHFFGTAMLLYHLLQHPLSKIPAAPGAAVSMLLFFLTRSLYDGFVGLGPFRFAVPAFFYDKPLLFVFGFRCRGISSADYYPLLPWIFLFFAGVFVGRYIRAGRFPGWFYRLHFPRLAWIGRHTLWIYLIHQPVLFAVLYAVFYLF